MSYHCKIEKQHVIHITYICKLLLDTRDSPESSDTDTELLLDRPLASTQVNVLLEDPLNVLNEAPVNLFEEATLGDDTTPHQAVMIFKQNTIDTDAPRQLFVVCRSEGVEQLKLDILGAYKNPRANLRATPRVRFEGEEGVGAGPIREFLFLAVKLVEEGIDFPSKPIIYFEGEYDHRIPIHNQALRQTGCFKAIGRILGHSFLHNGPSFGGLSPAVKHYFLYKKGTIEPPPLEIKDVPDVDLRALVEAVSVVISTLYISCTLGNFSIIR